MAEAKRTELKTPSRRPLFQGEEPPSGSEGPCESIHADPSPSPKEAPAHHTSATEQLLKRLTELEATVKTQIAGGMRAEGSKAREEGRNHTKGRREERSLSQESSKGSSRERSRGEKRTRREEEAERRRDRTPDSKTKGRADRGRVRRRKDDSVTQSSSHTSLTKRSEIRQKTRCDNKPSRRERTPDSRRRSTSRSPEVKKHCLKSHVFKVQAPRSFIPPALESFNMDSDPKEHLRRFNTAMLSAGAEDPFTARLFCGTLMGPAADWLDRIPPRSVGSMADLAKLFLRNWTQSKNQPRSSQVLRTIVQGKTETLRDYMNRYNTMALAVQEELDSTHLYLLTGGIRGQTPFALDIAKDPPNSLAEFKERTWQL